MRTAIATLDNPRTPAKPTPAPVVPPPPSRGKWGVKADVPIELYEWFREHAAQESRARGRTVTPSRLFHEALLEYRTKRETPVPDAGTSAPKRVVR